MILFSPPSRVELRTYESRSASPSTAMSYCRREQERNIPTLNLKKRNQIIRKVKFFIGHWLLPPGILHVVIKNLRRFKVTQKEIVKYKEVDLYTLLKYGSSNEITAFPLKNMRYQGGRSFSINQHHFVRFFKDGELSLKNFYKKHRPKNILEEHFIYDKADIFINPPPALPRRILPWNVQESEFFGEEGLSASHGNQAYGPASNKKISLEANRLISLLKSIKKHGYVPELFDGHPRGYLLINDIQSPEVKHFLVTCGLHRVATLSYLGFSEIYITFEGNTPREIKISDIENWPGVQSGTFSKELAYTIFFAYFRNQTSSLLTW